MRGYKAFNPDWTCKGFKYEIGKTYELPNGEKPIMCKRGFHFCKNPIDVFGYYPFENTLIAEVDAEGETLQEGTKFVTNKITILKEFTRKQLQALILDGKYNTGENNSGDCNSGDCNSGDCNSGNYNSGDCNSGYCNSGYCNSGNYNSGIFNTNEPTMRAFNKDTGVRFTEWVTTLAFNFCSLCCRISDKNLLPEDTDRIKALPNFDAEIFEEITGIKIE